MLRRWILQLLHQLHRQAGHHRRHRQTVVDIVEPAKPVPNAIGVEIDDDGNAIPGKPVVMPVDVRMKHVGVFGSSGSGKSVFLRTLGLADEASGDINDIFIDPQGSDLVDTLLAHFAAKAPPESYAGRLGLIDATSARMSNHNPLFVPAGGDPELVASRLVARILARSESTGSRWPVHLMNIVLALAYSGIECSPMDIVAFTSSAEFRQRVLAAVGSRAPFVTRHFDAYMRLSDTERMAWDAPIATHVGPIIGTKFLRRIYRPGKPFDLAAFINSPQPRFLLCALRTGLVPRESALLAGSTLLGDVLAAGFARDSIPERHRRPTFVTIDEAHHFAGDESVRAASVELRKYRIGLCIVGQSTVQIPGTDLRREISGNLNTILAGRLDMTDAAEIVRDSGADDVRAIRKRQTRLAPGDMLLVQKGREPRFVRIDKDPDVHPDPGAVRALREIALETMGAHPVNEIDAEIEKRYASILSTGPVDQAAVDVRPSPANRSHRRRNGGADA